MAKRALIVGGGVGGMSCAIALRRIGWSVDLVDIDPAWRALGAGLTLSGPTLRAFRQLGVLDDVKARGCFSQVTAIAGENGVVHARMPTPECEPGIAGMGGILRPVLHRILSERVQALGTVVRLGVGVTKLDDEELSVQVTFSDGATGEYDLVLGADSLNSGIRKFLFGNAYEPRFTGEGCWRLVTPKPPDWDGVMICGSGPRLGFNPVSETHMYMFLTVPDPNKQIIPEDGQIDALRELLAGFGGFVADIRDRMDASYMVNYRPLETLFVNEPWHKGHVLLIGDAAHSTTPHLGHGAGLAIEDALVLGDELSKSDDLDEVFDRFMSRRFDRARQVIETSLQIAKLELDQNWGACLPLHALGAAKLMEAI